VVSHFFSDVFVLAVASIGAIDFTCPIAKMTVCAKAKFNSKVISKAISKVISKVFSREFLPLHPNYNDGINLWLVVSHFSAMPLF
jgi:hypothetical protein